MSGRYERRPTSIHHCDQGRGSIITPIHKNADRNDPSNYRGVAVADCISKVFCRILNDRIKQYLDSQGFWKISQNGFLPDRQTVDNIMVLHTVFQKYVRLAKQRVYVAFVDFSKFFDSLNRDALLYKLLKCGITGDLYKVLKSAYQNSNTHQDNGA